jgi:hypothetical protein
MKIISINCHPRRFPPGSRAIHRQHGWCEVLAARGEQRRIRWFEYVPQEVDNMPDPVETRMGIDPDDIVEQELIVSIEADVSASELRA